MRRRFSFLPAFCFCSLERLFSYILTIRTRKNRTNNDNVFAVSSFPASINICSKRIRLYGRHAKRNVEQRSNVRNTCKRIVFSDGKPPRKKRTCYIHSASHKISDYRGHKHFFIQSNHHYILYVGRSPDFSIAREKSDPAMFLNFSVTAA